MHSQAYLSNAEKLVYLQQALNNSMAKGLVSNLSPSGDQYLKAVSVTTDSDSLSKHIYQHLFSGLESRVLSIESVSLSPFLSH